MKDLTLMGKKRFNELPEEVQEIFSNLSDDILVDITSILQGGLISAGFTRQKEILPLLKSIFNDIKEINGVFDFVSHEHKIYVDSKSKSYNNNVRPSEQAFKYKEENKEGYKMIFVITNTNDPNKIGWPVDKYLNEGIEILTIGQLLEKYESTI